MWLMTKNEKERKAYSLFLSCIMQELYSELQMVSVSTGFCDKPDSVLEGLLMALLLFFSLGIVIYDR